MIINPKDDEVLTQSVSPVPEHNRLGAVFVRGPGDAPAWVAKVLPSSPASEAGLKNGDVITKVDDTLITDADALVATVRSYRPGDKVTVTYTRGGDEHTVQLTLDSDSTATNS